MSIWDNIQTNYSNTNGYSNLGNFSTWGGDNSSLGSFAQPINFLNTKLKASTLPKINPKMKLGEDLFGAKKPKWNANFNPSAQLDPNMLTSVQQSTGNQGTGRLREAWNTAGSDLKQMGKDFGKDILNNAPEVAETALNTFGLKEADNVTGFDKGLQSFSSGVFKKSLSTFNPWIIGGAGALKAFDLANRYFGKTTKKQGTTDLNTGAYTQLINNAAGKKRTLLSSGKKTMRTINSLTDYDDRLNMMGADNTQEAAQDYLAAINSASSINANNQTTLLGGLTTRALVAKKGTKISPAKLRNVVNKVKHGAKTPEPQIEAFAEGGKLQNVIPDGALHARKNNLPDEISEKVTNKGIPVVTFEDGGDITQHAEIEVNEIIFNKETTDKLEDLFKQWKDTEDSTKKKELAIECGKFLTSEILENTVDNTGLLNTVE